MSQVKTYTLPPRERLRLHGRAYRAQQRNHFEVGGLLLADRRDHLCLVFVKNRSNRPYHYEVELGEIQRVLASLGGGKASIIGTFHSHPIGKATLSRGDKEACAVGQLTLVYDVSRKEARLWRVRTKDGRRQAIEVDLARDPGLDRPKAARVR